MPEYEVSGTRTVEGDERDFQAPVQAEIETGEEADPEEQQVRDAFFDSVESPDEFSVEEVK